MIKFISDVLFLKFLFSHESGFAEGRKSHRIAQ